MPAAIYPRPMKLGGKTVRVTEVDGTLQKKEEPVESIVSGNNVTVFPIRMDSTPNEIRAADATVPEIVLPMVAEDNPSTDATPAASSSSRSTPPQDAAQLLLQLVNLLRADDKALGALKSFVNGLDSPTPTESAPEKRNKARSKLGDSNLAVSSFDNIALAKPDETVAREVSIEGHTIVPPTSETLVSSRQIDFPVRPTETNSEMETNGENKSSLITTSVTSAPKKHRSSKDKAKSHDKPHKSKSSRRSKHVTETPIAEPISITSIPPTAPSTTPSSLVITKEDDLTSDEAWYQVPDPPRPHDSDAELSLPHNLKFADLRSPPRTAPPGFNHNPTANANPRVNRALKHQAAQEHRKTRIRSRSPPQQKGYGNKYGTSEDAYKRSFPVVDAKEDLGIESLPKAEGGGKTRGLGKAIQMKGRESTVARTSVSDLTSTTVVKDINKKKEVAAGTSLDPSTGTDVETPTKKLSDTPVTYDFNPPSPRRVTRRIVLSSKDTGTQTSPPSAPSRQSLPSPPPQQPNPPSAPHTEPHSRPDAIHHAHYYNTVPRDTNHSKDHHHSSTKRSKSKHEKKPCPYTAETLPEFFKSSGGSNLQAMESLKSVDAGDDLMIISKPREQSVDLEREDISHLGTLVAKMEGKAGSEMTVKGIDVVVLPEMMGAETSALYALLTASKQDPEDPPAGVPITSPPSKEAKNEAVPVLDKEKEVTPPVLDDKKHKKHKREKKDKKDKKHKSKHRNSKKIDNISSSQTVPTGNEDILGDLIGEEIPNGSGSWSILNPMSP